MEKSEESRPPLKLKNNTFCHFSLGCFFQKLGVSRGLGCNRKIFKKHFLELSYNLVFKKYASHHWAIYYFRNPFRATVTCMVFILDFANYLIEVAKSPSIFSSYFWWREFYVAETCDHNIICHKRLVNKVNHEKIFNLPMMKALVLFAFNNSITHRHQIDAFNHFGFYLEPYHRKE